MRPWIDKLLDLTARSNEDNLLKAVEELARDNDFESYAFLALQPGQPRVHTNYPTAWQEVYEANEFKAIDPVLWQARRGRQTFQWSVDGDHAALTPQQRRFYRRAADFGIRSGISIPVETPNGGMAMLTLASSRTVPPMEIDSVAAASAVAQLFVRLECANPVPTVEPAYWLSPREAVYLKWAALGKTVGETAEIEQVKYNSVRVTIEELKRRFAVYNITQLVAIAVARKLI